MKKLKMLVLVAAIMFTGAISANTNPIKEAEPNSITETVGKLLKNPEFQLKKDTDALVQIAINQDNEMVVLSVDTENKAVESYIKSRLNYKKVSEDAVGFNKSFKIPVKMLKSK
ncbi:hypothetical protein [Winogradskyella sp.]|uniref:hypothetical protein n=1 Tax=Winogradskyella sp. TaxID=1883156 RepID=UPI0026315888|nr:hypothetical protein [Winogradskyella sp.]